MFIAALSMIPRLLLGTSQYVEYDGYWHVFIAQQDNWQRFWHDIYVNAHPPLFFLLLKAALHLGHSLLVYRSISIATSVLSVYVVGQIAYKITGSDARAYQCALAYGLALPGIIIACEVRSYMLSTFFILLSYSCFLNILQESDTGTVKARVGFGFYAILACLSEYYAFFYCGATLLLLFIRLLSRGIHGRTARPVRAVGLEIATAAPVLAIIVVLYEIHARNLAHIQGHLLPYYYDPAGQESLRAFLSRNWTGFANLFSPFPLSSSAALGALIAGLACAVIIVTSLTRKKPYTSVRSTSTLWMTGILMVELALAGVSGKYPFGGDLRQQFLAFPFIVLAGGIFVQELGAPRFRYTGPAARLLANMILIIAIAGISAIRFQQFPRISTKISADRMAEFQHIDPHPEAVYLDQLNLITFYSFHDDWKWSYVPLDQGVSDIDTYRLSRGRERMLVFRDTGEWNVDADQPGVYAKLASCLRKSGVPEIAVFAARQIQLKGTLSHPDAVRRSAFDTASKAGVCPGRLSVTSTGWYGDFRVPSCLPNLPRSGLETAGESPISRIEMNTRQYDRRLAGFYPPEPAGFRWTKREFVANLSLPKSGGPAELIMRLYVPDSTIRQLGDVTLTTAVNGHPLAPEKWSHAGEYVFRRELNDASITGPDAEIDFSLDRALPPSASDRRELGIVVEEISIEPEGPQ